jgi:hypothetical protein
VNYLWSKVFSMMKGLLVTGSFVLMTLPAYAQAGNNGPAGAAGSSVQSSADQQTLPVPSSLETDEPLQVITSPFRVGRLSLISLTAYQGYDTNPGERLTANGSEFSAFNAFVVYSIRHANWEVDLQYEPSVFVTPDLLAKNLTGNAVDFQAARQLSSTWILGIGEHFHYTPNLQSSIQGNGLAMNLGGGVSIQIPFLTTDQSLLYNTVNGSLTDRINSHSSITFFGDQSFIRLAPSSDTGGIVAQLPVGEAVSLTGTVGYNRILSVRDSITLSYDYRTQYSPNFPHPAQFNMASVGWSHALSQGVRMSIAGGPGLWSPGTTVNVHRTTLQGTFQLTKEFGTRGSIGVAAARSDTFNGILGNTFSNDYSLRIDRRLSPRLRFSASASYIQQAILEGHNVDGETALFEPSWSVSRNWSVFGQVRYVETHGQDVFIAPQKIVTMGVRWAWVPEKP